MKLLIENWQKYLKEGGQPVPGATTAAQLRDDPALSGYRSGATRTREIPADYEEEEGSDYGEEEGSRFTPEQQKVIGLIDEFDSAMNDENFQSTSDLVDHYVLLFRALEKAGVNLEYMVKLV